MPQLKSQPAIRPDARRHAGRGHRSGSLATLAIAGCLALCLAACGPKQVKGQAPFVSISSMGLEDGGLNMGFDVRNINDLPLEVDAVELNIRIRDRELTRHAAAAGLLIDPNTTETISMRKSTTEFAADLLRELESGQAQSLPFVLDGRIHSPEEGYLPFRNEGHIYLVPGRPGQFRAASSSVREPR